MSVAVLVPWQSTGCVWRERARARVAAHYAQHHPDWRWVEGGCPGVWSKGLAVADALAKTDADVLVIADADVWAPPEALRQAVGAMDRHGWAIPHLKVKRLSQAATEAFYAGLWVEELDRNSYRGVPGGGLVVVSREVYEQCPLDPRFLGWGGEDVSWGWALNTLYGPAWRAATDLWHLWHPSTKVGHVGSPESKALVMRWRFATRRGPAAAMESMLAEAREATWPRT